MAGTLAAHGRTLESRIVGRRALAIEGAFAHDWPTMRLLSSQVRYAICGIFDLAYNAQSEPVQLRVIGERQEIPPRYLEQIFQRLRKAGLVTGKRGPGGGYVLARKLSEISLQQVFEAVEGPIDGASLEGRGGAGLELVKPEGDPAAPFRPNFLWEVLAERFAAVLAETTLEVLCQEAARRGVQRMNVEFLTYQI
jgi:Rrf2 family iron-sulfur cluster assembly transcriptional regulator